MITKLKYVGVSKDDLIDKYILFIRSKNKKIFKIAFPTTFIIGPFALKRPLLPQMTVENEQFQHFIRQINTCFFSELSIKNGTFVAKGGVLEQKIIK